MNQFEYNRKWIWILEKNCPKKYGLIKWHYQMRFDLLLTHMMAVTYWTGLWTFVDRFQVCLSLQSIFVQWLYRKIDSIWLHLWCHWPNFWLHDNSSKSHQHHTVQLNNDTNATLIVMMRFSNENFFLFRSLPILPPRFNSLIRSLSSTKSALVPITNIGIWNDLN